jgi:hypothetical protein
MPRPSSPYDDVEIFGNLANPAIPVGDNTRIGREGRAASARATRAAARAREAAARRRALAGRSRPTSVTPRGRNQARGGRLNQAARNLASRAVRRAGNNLARRVRNGRRGRR